MPDDLRTPSDFAAALRRLRETKGLSIRALAARSGIPSATLGGYFAGRHLPSLTQPEQLAALLDALGVPSAEHGEWRAALARVRRSRHTEFRNPYRGLESFGIDDGDLFFGRHELTEDVLATIRGRVDGPHWLSIVGASGSGKSSLLQAGVLASLRSDGIPVKLLRAAPLLDDPALDLAELSPHGVLGIDQFEDLFSARHDASARAAIVEQLAEAATSVDGPWVVATVRADRFGAMLDEPTMVPLLAGPHVVVGPMSETDLADAIREPALVYGRRVEPELVSVVLHDASASSGRPASVLPLVSYALQLTWERAPGDLTARDYIAAGGLNGAIEATAEQAWERFDEEHRNVVRVLFARLAVVDGDGVVTRRRLPVTEAEPFAEVAEEFIRNRILTLSEDGLEVSHEAVFAAWPRLAEWVAEDAEALRVLHRVARRFDAWRESNQDPADLLSGSLLALAKEAFQSEATPGLTVAEREFVEASIEADEATRRRRLHARRRLEVVLAAACTLLLITGVLAGFLARSVSAANDARRDAVAAGDAALSRQVALEATNLESTSPALAHQLALAAYQISHTVEARSALLEVSSAPAVTRLLGAAGSMRSVYSPDGSVLVSVEADAAAHVFLRDPGDPLGVPEPGPVILAAGGTGALFAADFSPDGRLFAMGGIGGIVTMVDFSDPLHPVPWPEPLTGPTSAIQGLHFNRDGTELAAATSDPAVFRWRIGDGHAAPLSTVDAFGGSTQSVAYGPGGLMASGSSDGFVRLWHESPAGALTLTQKLAVGDVSDFVYSVAISSDGRSLAAGTKQGKLDVWQLAAGRAEGHRRALGGFPSWVNSVEFSHDDRLLAGVASGGIGTVWRTSDWTEVAHIAGPASFTSVDFSPDDTAVVAGSVDGTAQITQLASGALPASAGTAWAVAYTSSGDQLFADFGSGGGTIAVIDTSGALPKPTDRVLAMPGDDTVDGSMALVSDHGWLASGTSTGAVGFFRTDASRGARPYDVIRDDDQLTENVAVSSDGSLLATAADTARVRLYRMSDDGHPTPAGSVTVKGLPLGVAFSPDGSLLAVATTEGTVLVYRTASLGSPAATIQGLNGYVYGVAFSPDGRLLAAGASDRHVHLWDVTTPTHPTTVGALAGPSNVVLTLAFSPDGRFLAAGSNDDKLWLWSLDDDEPYAALGNLGGTVNSVAFDPRGGVVAGGGSGGHVVLWRLDPAQVAASICHSAGDPMTTDEWRQYVPTRAYQDPCA